MGFRIISINQILGLVLSLVIHGFSMSKAEEQVISPPLKGVFAFGGLEQLANIGSNIINLSYVDGLTVYASWAVLEPIEGQYNWQNLDYLKELAKGHNKIINVQIVAGSHSPEWLFKKAGVETFTWERELYEDVSDLLEEPTGSKTTVAPLPWNPKYLLLWRRFLTAFAKRYGNEATIGYVAVTGLTLNGISMGIPLRHADGKSTDDEIQRFKDAGYSDELITEKWKRMVDFMSNHFGKLRWALPVAPLLIGEKNPWPALDLVHYGLKKYPKNLIVMGVALNDTWFDLGAMHINNRLIEMSGSFTYTGYTMSQSAERNSRWKTQEPIVRSLQNSLDNGLRNNISYVEVWANHDLWLDGTVNSKYVADLEFVHKELHARAKAFVPYDKRLIGFYRRKQLPLPLHEDDQVPWPKRVTMTRGHMNIGSNSSLVLPNDFSESYHAFFEDLKGTLGSLPSLENENVPPVTVTFVDKEAIANHPNGYVRKALRNPEGYVLKIDDTGVSLMVSTSLGGLRGLTVLQSLIEKSIRTLEPGVLRNQEIADWPDLPMRVLHLNFTYLDVAKMEEQLRRARKGHYNTVILALKTDIELNSMKGCDPLDPSCPAWKKRLTKRASFFTREEFRGIVEYAQQNGLEVIPEIKLLTHQSALLGSAYSKNKLDLMNDKCTYSPAKASALEVPDLYEDIIFPILSEVIELVRPKAIHIGHDEVAGHKKESEEKCFSSGQSMLPPDEFLSDVRKLHTFLKDRRVETWMWGDMLLSPDHFPEMNPKNFHGKAMDYWKLLKDIPSDIVVCDWHYHGEYDTVKFGSALVLAEKHRILGATWNAVGTTNAYSRFINAMRTDRNLSSAPQNAMGMIATTWFRTLLLAQNETTDDEGDGENDPPTDDEIREALPQLYSIIRSSADVFWNASRVGQIYKYSK